MALQFSVACRNSVLDIIESAIGPNAKLMLYNGTIPASCADPLLGNTLLVQFNLASDWASNASSGQKSFSGLPLSQAAIASGNISFFRLFSSDGTSCHMQGTVTAAGGGGDLTVDDVMVLSGQLVQITACTLYAPGA